MEKEICRNCVYYKALYRQRAAGYEKLQRGDCSVHKQEQKYDFRCDSFKHDELKEKRRKMNLRLYLEQASKSIIDVIQILKEDYLKLDY